MKFTCIINTKHFLTFCHFPFIHDSRLARGNRPRCLEWFEIKITNNVTKRVRVNEAFINYWLRILFGVAPDFWKIEDSDSSTVISSRSPSSTRSVFLVIFIRPLNGSTAWHSQVKDSALLRHFFLLFHWEKDSTAPPLSDNTTLRTTSLFQSQAPLTHSARSLLKRSCVLLLAMMMMEIHECHQDSRVAFTAANWWSQ